MLNPLIDQTLSQLREEIMKAETKTSYTFSPGTRSIFSPQNLDEEIKYIVPVDTPLRTRLPRTQGKGEAAVWKRMTSALNTRMQGAYTPNTGTNTSVFFADAGAPNATTQTYDTVTAVYKLLGRSLEVGGLALAASQGRDGQPDMQKERERVKVYEVMLGEEEAIIAGDVSNSSSEFDGLNKQITTNSGTYSSFVTYSGVGSNARTLYAYGADPTLLITNPRQLEALANNLDQSNSLIRSTVVNGAAQAGLVGGYALSQIVNPVTQSLIDVKPSRFTGATGLLLTEKSPAGTAWIEMEDLIPVSRVDVPSSNFSYTSFILEASALKVIAEVFQLKFTCGV